MSQLPLHMQAVYIIISSGTINVTTANSTRTDGIYNNASGTINVTTNIGQTHNI